MPSERNLFDFSSEVEAPTGPSGLSDDLLKEVLRRREQIVAKLVSGTCKTMESYAEAVGGIRQIDFILNYAERKRQDLERSLGTPISNFDEE